MAAPPPPGQRNHRAPGGGLPSPLYIEASVTGVTITVEYEDQDGDTVCQSADVCEGGDGHADGAER